MYYGIVNISFLSAVTLLAVFTIAMGSNSFDLSPEVSHICIIVLYCISFLSPDTFHYSFYHWHGVK